MASSAATSGGEHSIQVHGADAAGGGSQRSESTTAVPPAPGAADGEASSQPEKCLNRFVRFLATGELVGDALGKVASLWATVVLLGGYRSSLKHLDFWIATAMVFLEAIRVFIRNFKLDSQSLFGSTKAFRPIWLTGPSFTSVLWRPQEGDAVVLIIGVVMSMFAHRSVNLGVLGGSIIRPVVLTLMTRKPLIETMRSQLQRRRPKRMWALLIFPLAHAILTQMLRPPTLKELLPRLLDSLGTLTQVVALVLLYFKPRRIGTLTSGPWGRYLLSMSKGILALLMPLAYGHVISSGLFSAFSTVVLLLGSLQDPMVPNNMQHFSKPVDLIWHLLFLLYLVVPLPEVKFGLLTAFLWDIIFMAVLLIGNLQIPATVAQIVLSSCRLANPSGDDKNMVASIRVFYVLVLCQGLVYILACILALFSVVPRRSLARRSGFGPEWGARAVDLYYERAYTKRIEIGIFAEDTISLASFVVDSLNSASSISRELHLSATKTRELQLVGVRVLHCLLQQKDSCSSHEELISVITKSEKAVPTLISMLGWTFKQDRDIRLFAAMATADLSGHLRIAGISGAVRLVSSLLDAKNQPPSESNGGMTLPVLGMMILERLACDPDNCAEIVKDTNLIPKVIGLISYTSHDESNSNSNILMISSSLNLVSRIATTNGKVGATLRQELWESPFLLSNLTSILEDIRSSPEVWKPAIDIIATLALDEGARHDDLGSVQMIIHKLLHIFITEQDGPLCYDQLLRVAAGGALANLSMESPENCLAMLEDQQGYKYDLVKDLKGMLSSNEYRCVAASLLQNLCECSRMRDGLPGAFADVCSRIKDRMSDPGICDGCSRIKDGLSNPGISDELSSALRVVLQNLMAAEGKQLEALIGLASQICYVLPHQPCVQGLESHIIGATIVQKLVNTLNSNKQPSHEYPRMRRAIVDMVISVLRHYPGYAIIFKREGMVDALSKAEKTPSKVEKYRVFLGKEGVVLEHGIPLRKLVAAAKGLIHHASPA